LESTTQKQADSSATHLEKISIRVWHYLSKPGLTAALTAVMAGVVVLGLVMPQEPPPPTDAAAWITRLPAAIRPWGQPLYFLGLSHIFSAWWFWLPAALLLLHSLIMSANLLSGVWRRLTPAMPPITWQHPLSRRAEHVVRLPHLPDEWLSGLRQSLSAAGFTLQEADDAADDRLTGAVKYRWAWLGWPAVYTGLVLLVIALFVSHIFLEYSRLTLVPDRSQPVASVGGRLEQATVRQNGQTTSALIFSPADTARPALAFSGDLYRPLWLNHNLIIPFSRQPLLTVVVRDSEGQILRLIPAQEELPPDTKLHLPLTGTGEPLYFLIPAHKLAVQITPNPAAPQSSFNVQIRRGTEAVLSPDTMVEAGQSVTADGLHLSLGLADSLSLLIYFDPALAVYLLAILLVIGGLGAIFITPPVQLWLVPDIKGLGGQLYGVVETTGPVERQTAFLEQLLAPDE